MTVSAYRSKVENQPSLIFSVDVEDWAQSTLNNDLPIGEHCADNAHRLLDIISEHPQARGTFFVLGKFAEKHPDVVRALHTAGHEIACHGFGHVQLHLLDPERFRQDLRRAVGIISDLVGSAVVGYRAPVFSIGVKSLWAFDVLCEEGFRYDSSVFPIAGRRYGIAAWPREPRTVRTRNGATICEFPLTAVRFAGRNVPISGGGYARLLPAPLLRYLFRTEARRRATWPIFYTHPYEIDPHEFKRSSPPPPWGSARLPWKLRLHQGLGRGGFAAKLRLLMKDFRFRSFADVMKTKPSFGEIWADDFAQKNAPRRS